MRYITIDPARTAIKVIDADSYPYAVEVAGLEVGEVDHGTIERDPITGNGIGIVVYEYSLFVPSDQQRYFSIKGKLYAGRALLYAYNESGETIDLKRVPDVVFFGSARAVEMAIEAGTLERPASKTLGWQWPQPMPDRFKADKKK